MCDLDRLGDVTKKSSVWSDYAMNATNEQLAVWYMNLYTYAGLANDNKHI